MSRVLFQLLLLTMSGVAAAFEIDLVRRASGVFECITSNRVDCVCNPALGRQILERCVNEPVEDLRRHFRGEASACVNFHTGDSNSCPMQLARNCDYDRLYAVLNTGGIGFNFQTRLNKMTGAEKNATAYRLAVIGGEYEGKNPSECAKVRVLLRKNGTPEY